MKIWNASLKINVQMEIDFLLMNNWLENINK